MIDSLTAVLNDPRSHDTSLAEANFILSELLYVISFDTIVYFCEKTKEIAEEGLAKNPSIAVKKSLSNSLANALLNLGYYYGKIGEIDKQFSYYNQSLTIQNKVGNKEGIANCLINFGRYYEKQGNIPEALESFYESLKINKEIDFKEGIATSLNNLAAIFENQGDYLKALDYNFQSLEIRERYLGKRSVSVVLNNIGYNYELQGDTTLALEYYNRSLKLREEIGWKDGAAKTLLNIGYVYKDKNQFPEALDCFYKSLAVFEEVDSKEDIAYALVGIGGVLFDIGDAKQAKEYGERSLAISQEIGFPDNIKEAALLLSNVNEEQNKGMQALKMHKLYIAMRDSINSEETQKANAKQQAKYEYENKKAIDDAERDKMIAIEKEEKEKQQIITFSTIGILLLVVAFLFFIFNRLKITRKQKGVIEVQKVEVEKQRDVIKVAHKEITDSISYAQRIQKAILPPKRIVEEYLPNSFILYKPKDVVAGDFYWLRHVKGKTLFAAADCTGHGVPGAMVSVVCNNALNRSVREYGLTDPGLILDQTRDIVVREFEKSEDDVKDGMDIALCTIEGNVLQYAGAYNPMWIIRKGQLIEAKANRFPIGVSYNSQPYTTHTFELEKDDVVYIFTDGFVDQFGGAAGKKFKSLQFKSLLTEISTKEMEEQKRLLYAAFEKWRGDLEQVDDVCVIGFRF
jgi:serine phosphatase RsbU (regulator of sigma subunit)/Tfp pilus assembly protein PilF